MIGLVFLLITSTSYVSAMDASTHSMPGMQHSISSNQQPKASCVTLCISAPIEKRTRIVSDLKEDDREPYYTEIKEYKHHLTEEGISDPGNILDWPLLKVPLYIMYEVYRN